MRKESSRRRCQKHGRCCRISSEIDCLVVADTPQIFWDPCQSIEAIVPTVKKQAASTIVNQHPHGARITRNGGSYTDERRSALRRRK